jgi:hypothetical protein
MYRKRKETKMATKTAAVKTAKTIGERIYNQARVTKGCWLYDWANAPAGTPDWAKKWYLLKSDYPVDPGPTIKVTMTA